VEEMKVILSVMQAANVSEVASNPNEFSQLELNSSNLEAVVERDFPTTDEEELESKLISQNEVEFMDSWEDVPKSDTQTNEVVQDDEKDFFAIRDGPDEVEGTDRSRLCLPMQEVDEVLSECDVSVCGAELNGNRCFDEFGSGSVERYSVSVSRFAFAGKQRGDARERDRRERERSMRRDTGSPRKASLASTLSDSPANGSWVASMVGTSEQRYLRRIQTRFRLFMSVGRDRNARSMGDYCFVDSSIVKHDQDRAVDPVLEVEYIMGESKSEQRYLRRFHSRFRQSWRGANNLGRKDSCFWVGKIGLYPSEGSKRRDNGYLPKGRKRGSSEGSKRRKCGPRQRRNRRKSRYPPQRRNRRKSRYEQEKWISFIRREFKKKK
jgi:hypothetical protein